MVAHTAFEAYKVSQPEDRGVLLDRYRLTDVAFKVVGIGSVGTFCALGLFANRDGATLLLQLKEAQQSVLAPYAAPSVYLNQGQRVVTGQRIMQGEHDMFLGWTQEHGSDQYCYVRQLKDSRLAAIGEKIADAALPYYASLCGMTLARAHARSGDAARIAGYMGSSGAFDTAIADFAMAYAVQVESDWRAFVEAIKSGVIEARTRMITQALLDDAAALLDACRAKQVKLATAESCTGGLIAAVLTAIAGLVRRGGTWLRHLLERGEDRAARRAGGVDRARSARSANRWRGSWREGALRRSHADIVVSVTGVAGPGGGGVEKPVGLVWFGLAQRDQATATEQQVFPGDRTAIRVAAVEKAFALIRARL